MTDTSFDSLPSSSLIRINELCNRFERGWQTDKHESIELLLQDMDVEHRSLLVVELIGLEVELLSSQGEAVSADEYIRRFPFVDEALIRNAARCDMSHGIERVPEDDESLSSQQIGEYSILERIGSGGMGTVYKAIHRRMQRVVAIKLLRPEYAGDARFRERFSREVRAAAKLSHPNIVTAFDAGEFRGTPYLVSEFIDTQNLSQLIRDAGPLPVAEALDIVIQAAHGLRYIHDQGIIHRDIKPANLLRDNIGQLKILDVGLSRLRHDTDSTSGNVDLSGAGFLMGTIACMAPEQAANSRDVDERSDIYSLGCTLYFLLGGRHCFEGGSSVDQIVAHRQQPVPPLESPYGLVPDELAAVFCRMLAKQPDDRQASAKELIDELEACCVDPTISSSAATITRARPESDSVALNLTESDTCAAMSRAEIAGPRVGSLRGYITGSRVITGLFLILLAMPLWPTMKHILFGSNPNDTSKPDAVAVTDSSINGPPPAVAPFDAANARALQQAWAEHLGVDLEIHDERIGVDLILIPPGEFTMGSAPEEIARLEATFAHELLSEYQLNLLRSETPQRRIRITKPFYLSRTEVTLEQFAVFVDDSDYVTEPERSDRGSGMENGEWVRNQGDFFNWREIGEANTLLTDQHPVGNITWTDAMTYCRWCSRHGIVYRLPTEAEWEYSSRAGTETRWSWGNHLAAVHEFAALDHHQHTSEARITEPVGQRRPNPFGLFDMHGNQAEYCRDWYDAEAYAAGNMIDPPGPQYRHPRLRDFGDARVRRGGFITGGVLGTRSAARAMNSQDDPTSGGIRLLREVAIR